MKRVPMLLGLVFVALTTHRIADFAGGNLNAWLLAVALTVAVFVAAYLSAYKKARRRALAILLLFVLIDGAFNLGETLRWSVVTGRWDFELQIAAETAIHLYRWFDVIYGVFPTVAAVACGILTKAAEQAITKKSWWDVFVGGLADDPGTVPARTGAQPESMAEEVSALPAWLPVVPETKEQMKELQESGIINVLERSGTEIASYLPIGERATRKWLAYVKNGKD